MTTAVCVHASMQGVDLIIQTQPTLYTSSFQAKVHLWFLKVPFPRPPWIVGTEKDLDPRLREKVFLLRYLLICSTEQRQADPRTR
jgi:hypothetical protein